MSHPIKTETELQILKVRLVTGVPLDAAMAAFESGMINVCAGRDMWEVAAHTINAVATFAGRREADILSSDAQRAYHEFKKGDTIGFRNDPEVMKKIVNGTPIEVAYTFFKEHLYQNQAAVLADDYATIVTEMNDLAKGYGRKGGPITVGDVMAAKTHIFMCTAPAEQRIIHRWQTETEKRFGWSCPYNPFVAALREEIIRDYSHLWELNDEGHRVEHFDAVYRIGMFLNARLENKYDPRLILMAAFFHDLFAWSRKNHHRMSAEWVRTTDFPIMRQFTDEERALIAIGCEEHRASRKEPFTHEFGELISSADRGFPASGEQLYDRAMRSRSKTDEPFEVKHNRAVAHLKEKFGVDGYARLPDMYLNVFAEQLKVQRQEVMAL